MWWPALRPSRESGSGQPALLLCCCARPVPQVTALMAPAMDLMREEAVTGQEPSLADGQVRARFTG
jgi:hypothetical protein